MNKYQWVLKDMQHTCENVYRLSEQFYESYEEAVADIEKYGPEFVVWCRFIDPGFIKRPKRSDAFCATFPAGI